MTRKSLKDEAYREYDFGGRTYRIDRPKTLFVGQTTHRILDSKGIVHCVPVPGQSGCALRWKPRNTNNPVQF